LKVADKERKQEYENIFKDVAGVLVEKCVNPDSNRPYTITMLERALRDVHFSIDPKKSAKQQALEVLNRSRGMRLDSHPPIAISDSGNGLLFSVYFLVLILPGPGSPSSPSPVPD